MGDELPRRFQRRQERGGQGKPEGIVTIEGNGEKKAGAAPSAGNQGTQPSGQSLQPGQQVAPQAPSAQPQKQVASQPSAEQPQAAQSAGKTTVTGQASQPSQAAQAAQPQKKKGFLDAIFGIFGGLASKPKEAKPEITASRPLTKSEEEERVRDEIVESILGESEHLDEKHEKTITLTRERIEQFKERHGRYPTDNEYEEIAQEIYQQLEEGRMKEERGKELVKEKERAEKLHGREKRFVGPGKEMEAPAAEQTPGLNRREARRLQRMQRNEGTEIEEQPRQPQQKPEMKHGKRKAGQKEEEEFKAEEPQYQGEPTEGLFGEEEPGKLFGEEGTGEIGEGQEGFGELEGEVKEESSELQELEGEAEMLGAPKKCPNCKRPSNKAVYCPSCGNEFCDQCAKEKIVLIDQTKYICPVCSYEFKLKKG